MQLRQQCIAARWYEAIDLFSEIAGYVWSALLPGSFKESHTWILTKGSEEILIAGTLHARHLTSKGFTLADLTNLLVNYCPECVLIEARAEDLERGRYHIAAIEMAHLALVGRGLSLQVRGFDFWSVLAPSRTTWRHVEIGGAERFAAMFALLRTELGRAGRLAIFTGYSHLPRMRRGLRAIGYHERRLSSLERETLFAARRETYEPLAEVRCSIHASLAHLRSMLAAGEADNAWSRRLKRKIVHLEQLRYVTKNDPSG